MHFSYRNSGSIACQIAIAFSIGLNPFLIQPSSAQTAPTSINGSGSSFAEALYIGKTGTGVPTALAPKGSWFNTYGVGNPATLNPPGPVNATVTFRYAPVGSSKGVTSFLTQVPPAGTPTVPAPIAFGATDDPITNNPTATSPNQGC